MLVTTSDIIPGKQVEVLGLVYGNVVTSKNIARDVMAGFKNVVGGEIKSYTDMMAEGRNVAEERMIAQAQEMGANAIVSVRFSGGEITQGVQEMLAYGTAVKYV